MISKEEVRRKSLHLVTAFIPLFYYFMIDIGPLTGHEIVLILFAIFGGIFVLIDYLRRNNQRLDRLFRKVAGPFMREKEATKFTGASLIAMTFFFVLIAFPESIAVPACLLLSVADAASAIVGQSWGKHTWYKHYTLEGTAAFIVSGLALYLIAFPYIPIWQSCVTVVATAIMEVLWNHFDDNILIPIAAASFLMMLGVA